MRGVEFSNFIKVGSFDPRLRKKLTIKSSFPKEDPTTFPDIPNMNEFAIMPLSLSTTDTQYRKFKISHTAAHFKKSAHYF